MERKAIGAIVVALAIGAAGCGSSSSDKPLTRAEFTARASAICKHRAQTGAEAQQNARTLAAALRQSYPAMKRDLEALQALRPPASIRQRWVDLMAIEAMQVRNLGLALEGHPRRGTPIDGEVEVIHRQARLARELNLAGCI